MIISRNVERHSRSGVQMRKSSLMKRQSDEAAQSSLLSCMSAVVRSDDATKGCITYLNMAEVDSAYMKVQSTNP